MNENDAASAQSSQVLQVADSPSGELEAFNKIVSAIRSLTERDAQMRVLKSALTFLGWTEPIVRRDSGEATPVSERASSTFSEDRNLTPKQFLLEKKPLTDIERATCLAYYLTHFRETPQFKTLDISKLNTEAAQIKFSNAAAAVENAADAGLLIQAGKGNKQISAHGELYVQALPDREAAKEAIAHARPRRKSKRSGTQDEGETE